ncbi:MAG: 3-dehydroquinate synthase [Planctomycetota bacterium]
MNWPSVGRNILRPVLQGRLAEQDPPPTAVFVVLDRRAEEAARHPVERGLSAFDGPIHWIAWLPTEGKKNLAEAEKLARKMVRRGLDRKSLLLAAGGGVTSDLAGFLAATLLRGIRWGVVPTTLLGMADAALGGKTAVDLPEGKNLLGAFHPPEFVICDVHLLRTLPRREWNCGLGEVLKAALIGDADLLHLLEEARPSDLRRPGETALAMVKAAAELKMRVVERDPLELGDRMVLNLGHTFAHALETAAGHKKLPHGEAVALGILCALRMSEELGVAEKGLARRVRGVVARLGLPTRFPGKLPTRGELSSLMKRDKKSRAGKLDLVLPVKVGECLAIKGVDPAIAVSALHRELA